MLIPKPKRRERRWSRTSKRVALKRSGNISNEPRFGNALLVLFQKRSQVGPHGAQCLGCIAVNAKQTHPGARANRAGRAGIAEMAEVVSCPQCSQNVLVILIAGDNVYLSTLHQVVVAPGLICRCDDLSGL